MKPFNGIVSSLAASILFLACISRSGSEGEEGIAAARETDATFVYDFEDGSAQGWVPRGPGTSISASQEAAYSGSFGLIASGRGAPWAGPSLRLEGILEQGAVYEIKLRARLASAPDAPRTVRLSMEEKAASGSTAWKTLAQATVKDGAWLALMGVYSNVSGSRYLTLYVESDAAGDVLYVDEARISLKARPSADAGAEEGVPPLKERYAGHFKLGAAVEASELAGTPSLILAKHFDVLVAGNAMKPASIQPREGAFNWADADRIVAFAEANGMGLRFHTLQWHEQCPDWFFKDAEGGDMLKETNPAKRAANKALLLQRLEAHIAAIGARYAGRIASWDVVNEVIDESQPDGMRRSPWYLIAGEDFVETAFRSARTYCGPKAMLYINDFNTHEPAKRDALLGIVKRMLANGVPIDGVGHQTHVRIGYPEASLIGDSIRAFGALGLDNEITELDVSVYANDSQAYEQVPERVLLIHADRYKELFDEFSRLSGNVSTVVLWGIADNNTWLDNRPVPRKDAPLLFGIDYKPKPAFWALVGQAGRP